MPRPAARLANCFVPLLLTVNDETSNSNDNCSNIRSDRQNHELRQLRLETSVLANPTIGSSLVELGHTKVLCGVSLNFTHPDAPLDRGMLECKVQYAPHIGMEASQQRSQAVMPLDSIISAGKLHSETLTKESSLSQQLHSALASVIPLEEFPKCALTIHATILQDDGSVLSCCITAASLALADAKVEMYDLVTSCTVAVVATKGGDHNNRMDVTEDNEDEEPTTEPFFLADPTEAERLQASAVICLAMTPNLKEVTLWSQSGRLDANLANQAIDTCRNGCRTMHKFMREVWINRTDND